MTAMDLKQLYRDKFSSHAYKEDFYGDVAFCGAFYLRNIYDLFAKGKISGKRAIDFGAGPTIHLTAVASKFCETLVTSDFTPQNREQLKLFLQNDPQAFDWTPYLKLCAQLEGMNNTEEGAKVIASRLRKKVIDIIPCDATKAYPLEKRVEPFDLLFSCGALESATITQDDYINAVKNLVTLVKAKGKIVLMGVTNSTWYVVNGTKFPCCDLSKELVKKAFSLAGCTADLYLPCQDDEFMSKDNFDSKEFFIALFTKI